MIIEVPSNLVFYGSMILWNGKTNTGDWYCTELELLYGKWSSRD